MTGRRNVYSAQERRWGRRVVEDLREELGRDPTPGEVIEEAKRRSRSGLGPPKPDREEAR